MIKPIIKNMILGMIIVLVNLVNMFIDNVKIVLNDKPKIIEYVFSL